MTRTVENWLEIIQSASLGDDILLAKTVLGDVTGYQTFKHDDLATLINLFTALRIAQLAKAA